MKVFVLNRITEEEVSFEQMEVKERSPEDGTDEVGMKKMGFTFFPGGGGLGYEETGQLACSGFPL